MTSLSILPTESDNVENNDLLALHLASTTCMNNDNSDRRRHNIHLDFDEQRNVTNGVALHSHDNDGHNTPSSPISVLGARPMIRSKLLKSIISHEDVVVPSPQEISSSSSSTSSSSNSAKDNVDADTTKWTDSISTTQMVPSPLDGNHIFDSISEDYSTASVDDNMSHMIVPKWKQFQEKRLALCRQRVHLERRLFETSLQHKIQNNSAVLDQPMQPFTIQRRNSIDGDTYGVLWSGLVDADGLPTGFGRMIHLETGQVYEGHCARGLRHGSGRNVWTDNEQIYHGEWVDNQRDGRGTHTWPDGRSVTGSWAKGQLHGRVFYSWPNGTTYDGDVVHGQKEGRGTQTWHSGRVYTGQYQAGCAHGVGMLTESNQSKYRGQFQNGSRHGYGVQLWPNKLYEGEWYDNEVHGRGHLLWRDTGASYTGEFSHGLYHGIGIYKEGNNQYIGQWRYGRKEGEGKATWSDGRSYEGRFYRNKRHGYGRMVYSDCSFYIGGWQHGKRSGHGLFILASGTVHHCGEWINDCPVDEYRLARIGNNQKRLSIDDSSVSYQDYSGNRSES